MSCITCRSTTNDQVQRRGKETREDGPPIYEDHRHGKLFTHSLQIVLRHKISRVITDIRFYLIFIFPFDSMKTSCNQLTTKCFGTDREVTHLVASKMKPKSSESKDSKKPFKCFCTEFGHTRSYYISNRQFVVIPFFGQLPKTLYWF